MPFLSGKLLTEIIDEGPVAVSRALSITRSLLRGLAHAHQMGIVHRDIKPDNILLVEEESCLETPKILDFGIAKIISGATDANLTQAGQRFGTPN
jgi:serine/threonine-protein kinase